MWKGVANQESQISAIPPDRYGDRFVKFISGITKTRERAELELIEKDRPRSDRITKSLDDPRLAGVNIQRSSTDNVMEKAERQADRSRRRGADESDVPDRTIQAVRSPSAERGDAGGYTLPVVEEAAESNSVGGRSGRSDAGPHSPREAEPSSNDKRQQGQKPPPTPPKDDRTWDGRPPTPPKDDFSKVSSGPPTPPREHKEVERRPSRDKELPAIPVSAR